MPKKFQGENTKAAASKARKADAKAAEKERQDREREDALWADDNKHVQRKMQRKNDQEQKRQQQLDRKVENQKAYEQEMTKLAEVSKSSTAKFSTPAKVTQSQIEREKEREEFERKEMEQKRLLEQQKIVSEQPELIENVNRLQIEGDSATNVDEAIRILRGSVDGASSSIAQDQHPEKRLKAAYATFEENRLPRLKEEHPTLRLSQLKQLLKKEWQKSADNPLNQKIMNIIK
uniref:Coiled-coil domain-containing protein n=1 Tax=Meloidogyne incognita TaxID=6306 RepID=A0A914M325_MELIC